jgi:hypothetical protein
MPHVSSHLIPVVNIDCRLGDLTTDNNQCHCRNDDFATGDNQTTTFCAIPDANVAASRVFDNRFVDVIGRHSAARERLQQFQSAHRISPTHNYPERWNARREKGAREMCLFHRRQESYGTRVASPCIARQSKRELCARWWEFQRGNITFVSRLQADPARAETTSLRQRRQRALPPRFQRGESSIALDWAACLAWCGLCWMYAFHLMGVI